MEHVPNPRIAERTKAGPHLTTHEEVGFNGRLAMIITNAVGTMWCAYLFALIALISLPAAIQGGVATFIAWLAQTFIQLVLLSIIMVGQKVSAQASDKQALQTYKDAEALLKMQDEIHGLIEINNKLTGEIHEMWMTGQLPLPGPWSLRISITFTSGHHLATETSWNTLSSTNVHSSPASVVRRWIVLPFFLLV
jgi:hypothetical protein